MFFFFRYPLCESCNSYITDSPTWATLATWTPSCSPSSASRPSPMTCWGRASHGRRCPSMHCSGIILVSLHRFKEDGVICDVLHIVKGTLNVENHSKPAWKYIILCDLFNACRRFAHLMAKKDVGCPETKKDLLRKVKSAISSTAERFSGNMQNVSSLFQNQQLRAVVV